MRVSGGGSPQQNNNAIYYTLIVALATAKDRDLCEICWVRITMSLQAKGLVNQ